MGNDKKNNKEKTSEDYLKEYIQDEDNKSNGNSDGEDHFQKNIKSDAETRASDLNYFHFDASEFPLGMFYPKGTTIMVRPAMVKEVQAYSMVDDDNFYDVIEKMNDMIAACARVKYPDGSVASYLDIKDGDRFYLIFLIRELTFQKGNALYVSANCNCGEKTDIELSRKSFTPFEMDEVLEPFFVPEERAFYFETINGEEFMLAPPNIGIQKSFSDHILEEYKEKKSLNMSFLKIIPFMLHDRNHISKDGIKKRLRDFQGLDMDSFQFLDSAVGKMKFGIKELKKNCESCGLEVRTDMKFPNGAAAIFVVPDSFDKLLKK